MSEIKTYTNVFCEEDWHKIWSFLRKDNWSFGHVSNQGSVKKFWSMDFSENLFFTDHLFTRITELIENKFTIERVYANGQTCGLDGEFHQDSLDNYGYTFLYYPNKEWKSYWGGCTVIHDGIEMKSFFPMPNTAVMFPGKLLHCGNAPTRDFYDLRISIAYKLRLSTEA